MAKILRLVGLMVLLTAGVVHAVPILVTSPGALGSNDSVNWSQLGVDGTVIPAAFAATSAGGRAIAGSLSGSDGCLALVGGSVCSWAPGPGFAPGNFVLWAENASGVGSGPLSLSFAHVFGAGTWIQATAFGQFRAQIQVYNGASLLATLSELSDANGDGIFIGALDTVSDITRIVFSLASCSGNGADCNDFGVNSLLLNTTGRTVPEPASLSLLLLGAAGLVLFRRSRRASLTVAKEEEKA